MARNAKEGEMIELPEYVDGLPNISGAESQIESVIEESARGNRFMLESGLNYNGIRSACAIALHMHQPLMPAGGDDLGTAAMISNLQYMMEHQDIGDNHNAPVFRWCYERMGQFVPQLLKEGKAPRVMLDYSGTLLHGLRRMGLDGVIDSLKTITCDAYYRGAAEWLGMAWGHPVAPSTPVQDFRLHVKAWQHHFAAIFGFEALQRVRGFSPSEMALPNHPDVAYEFVKTLKDCGYQWVLVQEHSVEQPADGSGPGRKHIPHRLSCTNSNGETASIIAIIKTQGSDTKLVAQMQPYYEAKGLHRWELAGRPIPPLVTQIADGENGGVMMNEFPAKYFEVVRECSGTDIPLLNVSEYLEYLVNEGFKEEDFPLIQPIFQKAIWDRFQPGGGSEKLNNLIAQLAKEDQRFQMVGGSWTNNLSWVKGYENLLGPMEEVSALFYEKVLKPGIPTDKPCFRNALFHLLCSQTSDYRYWGQGLWTDYGREICRRTKEIIIHDC
jgi:hypothetical protein